MGEDAISSSKSAVHILMALTGHLYQTDRHVKHSTSDYGIDCDETRLREKDTNDFGAAKAKHDATPQSHATK